MERLCQFFCKLFGWKPTGKFVQLKVDESSDPTLIGKMLKGTIYSVTEDNVTNLKETSMPSGGFYAIIKLESPLRIRNKEFNWLVVVPRHTGYGFYRLCLTWIAVYIYQIEEPIANKEINSEDVLGVGIMKIK